MCLAIPGEIMDLMVANTAVVKENPIRVLFPVTQRELLEARRDNSAGDPPSIRVRLADGSFFKEKGKLDFIDVTVDPKTDGQIVRATFDNKEGTLTDGQTVRVVLEDSKVPSMIAIPQAAIGVTKSLTHLRCMSCGNSWSLDRFHCR